MKRTWTKIIVRVLPVVVAAAAVAVELEGLTGRKWS